MGGWWRRDSTKVYFLSLLYYMLYLLIFLIWSFINFFGLIIDLSIFAPNVFFWSTAPRIHRDRVRIYKPRPPKSPHCRKSSGDVAIFLDFSMGDFFGSDFFLPIFLPKERFAENTCAITLSRMWGTSPCGILFFITGLVLPVFSISTRETCVS